MPNQIANMVVVITGTSSGIGKAAALAFAQCSARLVLAARRERDLEETVAACRKIGTEALGVPTDVSDEAQVRALAARALEAFGRIDVWINNAAVECFGRFEEIPTAVFDRVIQVNLLGTTNGARAVLPHFLERGAGVIINNASMVGTCPSPFHSAYVASKFAIRGFSRCLCQELLDYPGIHVCLISPASIDTPLWQRAGNYTGRKIKPFDPVHPPELVADVMVDLVRNPQREVFAGPTGWMLAETHNAAPDVTEDLYAVFARQNLFLPDRAPPTAGAVFDAGAADGGISGGWRAPDQPAFPAIPLLELCAAPALLAVGPPLYAWSLWFDSVLQLNRQVATACRAGSDCAS